MFGLYIVKLSICLALAGGVQVSVQTVSVCKCVCIQYVDTSGTKVRGDCHLLLVGDPGLWAIQCISELSCF